MSTLPEVSTPDVFPVRRNQCQVSMMSQRVKGLATKTEDLSVIPRTHMVERENRFLQVVPLTTHTPNKCKIILLFQHTTVILYPSSGPTVLYSLCGRIQNTRYKDMDG